MNSWLTKLVRETSFANRLLILLLSNDRFWADRAGLVTATSSASSRDTVQLRVLRLLRLFAEASVQTEASAV